MDARRQKRGLIYITSIVILTLIWSVQPIMADFASTSALEPACAPASDTERRCDDCGLGTHLRLIERLERIIIDWLECLSG